METQAISGFQLSPQQKRLWHLHKNGSTFCSQSSVLIEGNLQPEILRTATEQVVNHHDILKTNFYRPPGVKTPVMVVEDRNSFNWEYLNLSALSEKDISNKIQELLWQERQEYQNLFQVLLRLYLIKLSDTQHILIISLPALCADTRTIKNLANQISQAYAQCIQGKAFSKEYVQYVQFSEWQNQLLDDEDAPLAEEYWQQQKISSLSALKLPLERQGKDNEFITDSYKLAISQELLDKIKDFAQKYDKTPDVILLACWKILVWRLTGESEIVIGAASERREYEELYDVLGLLATWLPIKTKFTPKLNFLEVLTVVSQTLENAVEWQDYFVYDTEEDKFITFPIGFEFENIYRNNYDKEVSFTFQEIYSFIEPFKIKLACLQLNNSLLAEFFYDINYFDKETIKRLAQNYQVLLINLINNPEIVISQLEILSTKERQQLLIEFNQTQSDYQLEKGIHQLFEEQVEKTPNQIAVVFENEELTYAQLNFKANQLAHYLLKKRVKPGVVVGICVERSPKFIISLLAVLKAGGAYLPLDSTLPQEAIKFRLQDAQVSVLIKDLGKEDSNFNITQICLDTDLQLISQESTQNPVNNIKTENLAYVIYTSGSTGKPKGVAVEHQHLLNYLYGILPKLQLSNNASYATVSTFAADLGNTVIFPCLCSGGCLHIVTWQRASDPIAASDYFRRHPIDCLKIVPSHLAALLSSECMEILPHQLLILGGEAADWNLIEKIEKNAPNCRILNHYGPTETTVGVLTYPVSGKIQEAVTVPIGKPIANTQVYVLDEQLKPVPLGVAGELYISGESLARGYLNHTELTNEKFINNPFSDTQQRLYKTGDRARYLSDGNLEFLGRFDDQVKIRGYRIELGEVSIALNKHPEVRESAVIIKDDILGEKRLVAYVVTKSGTLSDIEFRDFLKVKLPEYMIPVFFIVLKALPLTVNGKLDRNALPTPEEVASRKTSFIAPRTPVEEVLASIWTQLLGIAEVSINDNFFELGGHSLLATQVISRIRTTFGAEISLPQLFESSNLAALAAQIEAPVGEKQEIVTITPVSRDKNLPLSFAQQRLWFFDQFEPGSSSYNLPRTLRLQGKLNINALRASLNEIIRRHEILRTSIGIANGQPIQIISDLINLNLPIIDLQKLPSQQREAELYNLAKQEAQTGFDLTQAPLLRAKLLQLDVEEHAILLTLHHIISDGWSNDILIREVATLYTAFYADRTSILPQLPIQYADFAVWQRQWLEKETFKNQLAYWQKQLSGELPILQLPTDHPRPTVRTYAGKTLSFVLPKSLAEKLKTLSKQKDVTLFMTLLAAFKILLYRYTGQTDILVGSPIANRNRTEIENLIGFFVNTLVLRSNLAGNPSFCDFLKKLRSVALEAYAHQDLPFEKLVEEIQPQRNLSHNPLFQVMFVLQNAAMRKLELPGLKVESLENSGITAKFDLTLVVEDIEQGLIANFEYNIDLFDEITISRLAANFEVLLTEIVANPQQHLGELPLLTTTEEQQLLEWSKGKAIRQPELCLHQLFETQVEKTPLSVAVVFEDQKLTYNELNKRANQLAHHLRSLGVKPEVLVGICVERSLEMVIGLLAILKAGGAYVPLDPNYPQERLTYMLEDSQPSVLLTEQCLLESLPSHKAQVICLDSDWEQIASESRENPASNTTIDNLAYVIYTSGSTGKPKGAMNSHSGICNRLLWMQDTYQLTSADAVLQKTPFSFDVSVWEFFWTLMTGARLIVAQPEGHRDPNYLVNLIRKQRITTLHFVPSMLQAFLEAESLEKCQSLVRVIASGEAFPAQLQERFFNRINAQLHNLYGPTEAAVDVTYWQCKKDNKYNQNTVPIGQPIANIQIYILDKYLKPVPMGVAGEVYIGGEGLARGYFNRPDLSAEKFIPNPFSTEATRLYKTGDLARYLPTGDIEYIGRIDNQVKVRGFRIELGEIEAAISQYPAVRETVVVVREDSIDSQRIVAYVVAKGEQTLIIKELREFLESKLPNYMIPNALLTLEALPLTPNGKVDRKALPVPELTQVASSNIVLASTPIENLLAGIWTEVLGIEQVGIDNNFFELGGHSLIATRVMSQIRQIFQVELPLRYLFEKPTIAGLAQEVEKASKAGYRLEIPPLERINKRATELPLSFAQQRLWFLTQLEPNSSSYNIPTAVRLQGELNHNALKQSFNKIVCRHEVLRTNFLTKEGRAVAVISKVKTLTLPIIDISSLSAFQQQAEIKQQTYQEAQQPFDLNTDHLLRIKLLRLGEQEHIVLLTMHHIVSDAWSIGVLIKEIAALYPAFCAGKPSPLSELSIQYTDFAIWQRQWLQGKVLQNQLDYWKQKLGNTHPRLALPKSPKRSRVKDSQGAKQSFTLSKVLTEEINLLSRQQGATLFMTLLAVFQVLLYCFSGTLDIRVGSPIANRNRVEIEKLIGFFINTLVLRIDLSGNPTFRELLARSRQVTLEAYTHQDLPFEKLVEELQPERNLNRNPLYQAWFVLQNAPMPQLELPGLTLSSFEIERNTVRHDLLLSIGESSEGLDGKFEYKTNLFDEATISRLIEHFKTVINHVVAQPDTTLDEIATILTQSDEEQQKIQKQELQVTEHQKLKMTKRKIIRN